MSQLQINSHYQIIKLITILACVMFFLGIIYLLHPWASSLANATETPTELTVSANSTPYIDPPVSSVDKITMTIDPTATGTYASTLDTVTVRTNNPAGYSLYISTDDPKLYLNGNNSSEYYISSTNGTYSRPQPLRANSYGYAVPDNSQFDDSYSTPNPSTTNTWAALPTSNQLIQTVDHANTSGETLNIYYGAYLNNAVASGTYTGSVTYTAIPDEYIIANQPQVEANVSPTTGTAGIAVPITIVTNLYTMADVGTIAVTVGGKTCANPTSDTSTGILTISCTVSTALTAGKHTITVDIPSYSKTYTITNGYEAVASLRSGLYMQDVTTEMCNNTKFFEETGATYDLIDRRDNSTYRIRKLKDGNCWMVQNLRLEGSRKLTTSDSNVLNNDFTLPASTENWCTTCHNTAQVLYTGNPEYGTYYSWHAATAGTGTASMTSGDAPSSICPKSWHLPTGGANGEFYTLYSAYQSDYGWTTINGNSNDMTKTTYQNIGPVLTYSGNHNGATTYSQGVNGHWWSSTAYTNDTTYDAYVYSKDNTYYVLGGTRSDDKSCGFSVRCLLPSSS